MLFYLFFYFKIYNFIINYLTEHITFIAVRFVCPCMKHDCIFFFSVLFPCRVFVSVWVWLMLDNRMPHLPIRSEMATRLSNRILEQGLLQQLEAPVIDLIRCPSQPISSKIHTWLTCSVNPFPIKVHGYKDSQSILSLPI
jgi:hypothetical protein